MITRYRSARPKALVLLFAMTSCGVGNSREEAALNEAIRTASAPPTITATAPFATATPTLEPPAAHTVTSTPITTATPPPDRALAAARVAAIVARVMTTVGNQPIQIIGFANELDATRRTLQGPVSCGASSCIGAGIAVTSVERPCLLSGSECRQCSEAADLTTVTDEHDSCRSIGVESTGALSLEIPRGQLCGRDDDGGDRALLRFCQFTGVGRGSLSGTTTKDMSVALAATGSSSPCLLAQSSAMLTGTIGVQGYRDHVDQTFNLNATELGIGITKFIGRLCIPEAYDLRISGPVVLTDHSAATAVTVSFEEVRATLDFEPTGPVQIRIGGSLQIECLGEVSIRTAVPLVAAGDATCPDAGEVIVELGPTPISVRFAQAGQVRVDADGDGETDAEFASCVAPQLAAVCLP